MDERGLSGRITQHELWLGRRSRGIQGMGDFGVEEDFRGLAFRV